MSNAKIIDISYCQPIEAIDWKKLKDQGIGALIRGGQSTYEDNLFRGHWNNAVSANVATGMYWFFQPDLRPEYQAEACIKLWKSLTIKPKVIALDVENIAYGDVNILPKSIVEHSSFLATWLSIVHTATGITPMIYTRADYWDAWVSRNSAWKKYPLWIASWTNYSANIRLPKDWDTWAVWQYEGGSGRTDGVVGPVDQNEFNGTQAEMQSFFGVSAPVEVSTMAGIYKQTVPIADRGHFVILSSSDKQIDMDGVNAGADAVMLKMCSQDTGTMQVSKDAAFPIWVDRASKPVMGLVEMDQNLFWNKEITLPVFQSRSMWANETLRAIIEQWRSVPITQAEWDAHKLNITASFGWRNLNGLMLMMTTTVAKASTINGMWQQAIVDDLLKPLATLMEGGYIPKVPIYLMANWDWYRFYATDTGWTPTARIATGQLAGLGVMRVWGQDVPGLITDKAPMATAAAKLSDVWQYGPDNSFQYPFTVEGVNYSFFVFSFNRLRAANMFYADTPTTNVTPVTCGVWCDTATEMAKGLGSPAIVVGPPPIAPPVSPTQEQLLAKVMEWETWMANAPARLV